MNGVTTAVAQVTLEHSENKNDLNRVTTNTVEKTATPTTPTKMLDITETTECNYKAPTVFKPPSVKNVRRNHTNTTRGSSSPSSPDASQKIQNRAAAYAGTASPSGVCSSRRDSPVIKSTRECCHALGEGRESIVLDFEPCADIIERVVSDETPKRKSSQTHQTEDVQSLRRSRSSEATLKTSQYLRSPPTLRLDAWSEPPGTSFSVRGHSYLRDGVKVDSVHSVFRLLTVDVVKVNEPMLQGICSHPQERIQLALAREKETGVRELPNFIFCVNLVIPHSSTYHACFYFGIDKVEVLKDISTSFGKLASRFFFGNSDEFRNDTFKLIPRIVEGNFLVKKAVGSKPAILGKKIPITYIRTPRFFECVVNIAAEKVACGIVKLSLGYAKSLVVDMAFVLQGDKTEELPEQILGAVRSQRLDFKKKDGQRVVHPVLSRQ
mmetsp:Transcript_24122/g.36480  ORF Transcript_24122/g.36480 Transcript_24122/m.36480 type:complete len:437 (+) Transcript_24122:171-1481(+)